MKRLADYRDPKSLAFRMRQRRFRRFLELASDLLDGELRILDLGGTPEYWESFGFLERAPKAHLTILNNERQGRAAERMDVIEGDACDLSRFEAGAFDIVYSNSLIEHVGGIEDQRRLARAVRRVGQRYYVQTPNFWFPIEPHFLFPLFQFLPVSWRIGLLRRRALGWYPRTPDFEAARRIVMSTQLLSAGHFRALFPDATLERERFCGWTKSLVVHHGFTPSG